MTQGGPFQLFAGCRYISLETFRKSGESVKTPVWFAEAGVDTPAPLLYVYTIGNSGKAKRIRNNPRARIAPCDRRGKVLGDCVEARAEILQGEAAARGMRALNGKYVPWKQLLDVFASLRFGTERIVLAIRPA
jgi:hypothetical protein